MNDVFLKQISFYILGHLAEVHINLVKTCLQNLLYYNLIKMIPAFQYSNMYCITPSFHSKLMLADMEFKTDCLTFVARSDHVSCKYVNKLKYLFKINALNQLSGLLILLCR